VKLTLIRDGIHPNPGPTSTSVKPNAFAITTFNVRGTAQRGKLRTILSTFRPLVKKGHIVCLQETHSTDKNYFDKVWQMGKIVANGTGRSCGVIMLFNNDLWEIINEEVDPDGRYTVATLSDRKNNRRLLITNIYAPNDFNDSITFFNNVFDYIERAIDLVAVNERDNLELCLLGDFNFVVDETQCYRRAHTNNEKRLSRFVAQKLDMMALVDTMMYDTSKSTHTWSARGICSRLDCIYCNPQLINKIFNLEKTWGVARSDHAMVSILYKQLTEQRGPGIKGLKPTYLKNPVFVENVRKELEIWIAGITEEWTPHQKWDFCKVGLYSIASSLSHKMTSSQNNRKAFLIKELTELKINIASPLNLDKLSALNQKICAYEAELNDIHELEAESLFLQSGLKWREEGEKSSKYFLGLINKKRQESTISQMYNENGTLISTVKGILDIAQQFYENLYSKVNVSSSTALLDEFFY
jgi:exonuclease III